jgi:hypothetical protein
MTYTDGDLDFLFEAESESNGVGRDDPARWCLLELESDPGPGTSDAMVVVQRRITRARNVTVTGEWLRADIGYAYDLGETPDLPETFRP